MTSDQLDQLTLSSGTYHGECFGYCREELTVDRDSIRYESAPHLEDPSFPPRRRSEPMDPALWAELAAAFDQDAFDALPETIGCPDCYDQGGEFVSYALGSVSKRVDLEPDAEVEGTQVLLERLRSIRRRLAARAEGA